MKVVPEKTYSVKEAARYLGVHRCTIYAYICQRCQPSNICLPDFRKTDSLSIAKPAVLNMTGNI